LALDKAIATTSRLTFFLAHPVYHLIAGINDWQKLVSTTYLYIHPCKYDGFSVKKSINHSKHWQTCIQ